MKYGVRGYPTSLLLNARGETIGKVTARNARGYIRDIEQLAKKAEKTDKAKNNRGSSPCRTVFFSPFSAHFSPPP